MIVGYLRRAHLLPVRFALTAAPTPSSFHFLAGGRNPFSSASEESNTFTVTYLVNTCGLSHKDALSASSLIRFETPDRADSVLAFFDRHGFSKSQTSKMVKSRPQLLLVSDPDKIILPKLRFFFSRGASWSDVTRILVSAPTILSRSLENKIIPSFNFLKDFLESDEMAMTVVTRFSRILLFDLNTFVESNIVALRDCGVPKSNIAAFLRNQPRAFMMHPNWFREILEKVKKMGFNPSQTKFVVAIKAMRGVKTSTWERKINLYKRWGWSEEEIVLAFTNSPWCMVYSEDKISATMDFLVNKMGLESSSIALRPGLLAYSLEQRMIPRYSVVQVLRSKGLIKKDIKLRALFESTDKMFLQMFVNCYEEEAPQLLSLLYPKRVSLSGRGKRAGAVVECPH